MEDLVGEFTKRFDVDRLNRVGPLRYQSMLYAWVRYYKPEIVVETGVANGVSTVSILAAMEKNGCGHLWSCDPTYRHKGDAILKFRKAHGEYAKTIDFSRWTFAGEKSAYALERIAGPWDMFLHDSDHSKKNMAWELSFAWDRLADDGQLICDDHDWNSAFADFASERELGYEIYSTAAFITKRKTPLA